VKKIGWSGSRAGGCGAGSGSHRNRFERRVEILPLPLRSHALVRGHCECRVTLFLEIGEFAYSTLYVEVPVYYRLLTGAQYGVFFMPALHSSTSLARGQHALFEPVLH